MEPASSGSVPVPLYCLCRLPQQSPYAGEPVRGLKLEGMQVLPEPGNFLPQAGHVLIEAGYALSLSGHLLPQV